METTKYKPKDSSQAEHLDKISKSLDDTNNIWQVEYDKLQVKYDLLAEQSLNLFSLQQIETALNEYVKQLRLIASNPHATFSVPDFLASLGKK